MFNFIIGTLCGTLVFLNIFTPNGLITSMLVNLSWPFMIGGGDMEQAVKESPFLMFVLWLGFSIINAILVAKIFG